MWIDFERCCVISIITIRRRRKKRKEQNSLGFSVANPEETFIRGVSTAETIKTRETISSVEFEKQKAKELKKQRSEKRMQP